MSLPCARLVQMGNTNMYLDEETTEEVAGDTMPTTPADDTATDMPATDMPAADEEAAA